MQISSGFSKDPNSKTSPPGVAKIKVIDRENQSLVESPVRFAYLDEFERIAAERAGDAFAAEHKIIDPQHRGQIRRAFVISAFVRDFSDVDKNFFMTEAKAGPGEVALRRLGYPAAVALYEQWGKWMDAEFLTDVTTGGERRPTDQEQQELEEDARGES